MAVGKPVISTNLPGIIREFGKENGILYAGTPEMVPEMANTLSVEGTIKKHSIAARLYVQDLDWDTITDKFEKILFT